MKYLCLCCEDESELAAMSESEWASLREETYDYVDSMRDNGYLVDARPLQSVSTAMTVRVRNGNPMVVDGPFPETKEQLGGYFLIRVANLDEAIAIAAQIPGSRRGTAEIRPLFPLPERSNAESEAAHSVDADLA